MEGYDNKEICASFIVDWGMRPRQEALFALCCHHPDNECCYHLDGVMEPSPSEELSW